MIEIYDDRVEISNPGGLPKSLHQKYFGTRSICRNPIIASLLQRSGYIEKLGTGINRIRAACKNADAQEPVFDFDSFFVVIFKLKPEILVRKSSQKILTLIKKNPFITIEQMAKILSISDRAVKKHLAMLKTDGTLKRMVPDKGGHWEVMGTTNERGIAYI